MHAFSLENFLTDPLEKCSPHEQCKNLFFEICSKEISQKKIFEERINRLFQEFLKTQDEKRFCIKNKCPDALNCEEIAKQQTPDIDYQIDLNRICQYDFNAYAAKKVTQDQKDKTNIIMERLKNTYNKFVNNPSLVTSVMNAELVTEYRSAEFVNGVRDWNSICNGKDAIESIICKDKNGEPKLSDDNPEKQYICPGAKIYVPASQLEFSIAHELAHLLLSKEPQYLSPLINSIIGQSPRIKKMINESKATTGSGNQKIYEEIAADVIAIEVLKSQSTDMKKYLPYFCNLYGSETSYDDYYKEEISYMHPQDRMQKLFCPLAI